MKLKLLSLVLTLFCLVAAQSQVKDVESTKIDSLFCPGIREIIPAVQLE